MKIGGEIGSVALRPSPLLHSEQARSGGHSTNKALCCRAISDLELSHTDKLVDGADTPEEATPAIVGPGPGDQLHGTNRNAHHKFHVSHAHHKPAKLCNHERAVTNHVALCDLFDRLRVGAAMRGERQHHSGGLVRAPAQVPIGQEARVRDEGSMIETEDARAL